MSECQVVIILVGSMTNDEEGMIHYITNETAKRYSHKKVIVVHNFVEINSSKDL